MRSRFWGRRHLVVLPFSVSTYVVTVIALTNVPALIDYFAVSCFSQLLWSAQANCIKVRRLRAFLGQTHLTMHYLLLFVTVKVQILGKKIASLFLNGIIIISWQLARKLFYCSHHWAKSSPLSKRFFRFGIATKIGACLICSSSVTANFEIFERRGSRSRPRNIFPALWILDGRLFMNTSLKRSLQ